MPARATYATIPPAFFRTAVPFQELTDARYARCDLNVRVRKSASRASTAATSGFGTG